MRNFLFILMTSLCHFGFSQNDSAIDSTQQKVKSVVVKEDTLKKERKPRSPMKASILAAVAPGAGQIYNRKYWKAPIVWGGAYGLYLMYDFYNRKHNFYHQILIYKDRGGNDDYIIPYVEQYGAEFTGESPAYVASLPQSTIQLRNDGARQTKQQIIIGFSALYLLQIVDATVDAHFSSFDISEDLTLNISPATFQTAPWAQGVKLNFRF